MNSCNYDLSIVTMSSVNKIRRAVYHDTNIKVRHQKTHRAERLYYTYLLRLYCFSRYDSCF